MVKTHKLDHHPVKITKGILNRDEDWSTTVMLEPISALLHSGTYSAKKGTLNLAALCVAAGIDIPAGAVGILLDVDVRDSGAAGAAASITFGYGGVIDLTNYPGRSYPVYCQGLADRWIGKTVVLPLESMNLIDYVIDATGASTFDVRITLAGWLIGGESYTQPEHPNEELHCAFRVNQ